MFGRRADGRVLREIDPIIALTPYLMPMRCDAQVMSNYKLDYEKMARYIVEQGNKGHKFTFMEIIFAAFVRAVSQIPEINRFVVNKRLYARTQLTISFALLKDTGDPDKIEENTVKCYFDPRDTIYDVEGAAAFGIPTVGVRWGYGDPEEMLRAGATAVLDTPEDLLDYLTGPDGSGAE